MFPLCQGDTINDPCYNVDDDDEEQRIVLEEDCIRIEENNSHDNDELGPPGRHCRAQIGIANTDNEIVQQQMLARPIHWRGLNDRNEHARLHSALLQSQG
jgi:hypothetical protein